MLASRGVAHLLLFDGECGLCQRAVRFVVARDDGARFLLSPLQSPHAARALKQAGVERIGMDTLYVLRDDGTLLERSEAALFAIAELGGAWAWARWLRIVPRVLRDAVYDVVARNRHRVPRECPVPTETVRARFAERLREA